MECYIKRSHGDIIRIVQRGISFDRSFVHHFWLAKLFFFFFKMPSRNKRGELNDERNTSKIETVAGPTPPFKQVRPWPHHFLKHRFKKKIILYS